MFSEISNRIRLSITKALIKGVDDTTKIQLVKALVLDAELPEGVERVQNYGLTSNPPTESEAIAVEVSGSRDNLVIIAVDSAAHRVKNLKTGEVCFYSQYGQTLKHDENGDTLIDATSVLMNGGGRSAARINDDVVSTVADDSAFWAWVTAVSGVVNSVSPGAATPPVSLSAKITSASSSVELPND